MDMLNVSRDCGPLLPGARMVTRRLAEKLACDLLARDGIKAIWDLHLAAAAAKGAGKLDVAASLIEIADAAERLWKRQEAEEGPV